MKNIFLLSIILFLTASIYSQNNIYIPLNVQNALQKNTRSLDGRPGKSYWQNKAEYDIKVYINPETRLLTGSEQITYYNNSPDSLSEIVFHLFPNIYKKGAPRDFGMDPDDEGEGVSITSASVNGKAIQEGLIKNLSNRASTIMQLKLDYPILPGKSCTFSIQWKYTINKGSEIRTGTVDSTTFFFAYFYPRIAVYDDIDGWNISEYTGQSEFYNDFSDYNVKVTVPQNQKVWATGILVNPEQVLNDEYAARFKSAFKTDGITHIIDSTDYLSNSITRQKENTWNFKAEKVVDFAFGISDHYLWDATSFTPDKDNSRRVLITAAYNKNSHDYYKVAETTKKVLQYMSETLPGYPYPYPAMTVFNGGSAMEYPMMVNDVSEPDSAMPGLTAHEVSHTYFPFFLGINETKYAYMDEGFGAFFDYLISSNVFGNQYIADNRIKGYMKWAGKDLDMPIYSISKYLRAPVYRNNAYIKAAVVYLIMKDLLGDELFRKCMQEYITRWNSKHPIPNDFFNTFMNVTGLDLTWLINPWFYEFGYVDVGIKDVQKQSEGYKITVERIGKYPVPVRLNVFYADGSKDIFTSKADIWKNGEKETTFSINTSKTLIKADLFDKFNLDFNSSNDAFINNK